ncbi:phosphatidylinositol-glycan biosynthesis class X protein [Trifolium repens]|nr:phosphatidylinositol-glycan biosynthesis class X protein [Trifolium repens]
MSQELASGLCEVLPFYDDIHLDVDPNTLLLQPTDISIEFPLHARYQSLNESGYSILEFGAPDMAHSELVSTVTFLIAFLTTLVIMVTSLHYFNSRVSKELKQF